MDRSVASPDLPLQCSNCSFSSDPVVATSDSVPMSVCASTVSDGVLGDNFGSPVSSQSDSVHLPPADGQEPCDEFFDALPYSDPVKFWGGDVAECSLCFFSHDEGEIACTPGSPAVSAPPLQTSG